MAGVYYAIARQQAEWIYVCSGPDPAEVYHSAVEILQGYIDTHNDQAVAIPPLTENLVDSLRIVPATVARQQYQVKFLAAGTEEHGY